jgi:hypothetical protein
MKEKIRGYTDRIYVYIVRDTGGLALNSDFFSSS